ncbi:MAG: isoprenylcysteine carboxylmethyltransferase family protein [Treponema sp.]
MSKQKNHLPVIGVGPLYVVPIVALTIVSILLIHSGVIPSAEIDTVIKRLFQTIGVFFIGIGVCLWYAAVVSSRIDSKIKTNTLVTDGIYAHVRNPIYSAFLFACSGSLILVCNIYVLILPPLFWLYLTILMKLTEEKWLLNLYGKEFEDYCKRVNRCIPSIRAKNN